MHRSLGLVFVLAALLCAGCGGDDATFEMEPARKRERPRHDPSGSMSAAERLRTAGGESDDPHAGLGLGPVVASETAPRAAGLRSTTPPGWIEKQSSGMRQGSWAVQGQPQTDCSLIVLSGTGGGLAANIERWRKEMGAAAGEPRPIDQWPQHPLLGGPATYVEFSGTFSGGRGTSGRIEDARLLGLLLEQPGAMVFLKFTGPSKVVEAQRANFEALADSIEEGRSVAAPSADAADPGHGIAWDAPPDWQAQPARAMRLFTYVPAHDDKTWCYGTRMRGSAGGLASNVNRWRQEMGQQPLPQSGIDALPRVKVLGREGVRVDLAGDFRGTGGAPLSNARMLGFIVPGTDATLFLKMVGPATTMDAQREHFDALCRSLRDGP